ncbi:site-specific integrase [Ramlibacter sp.]|uniref:tyrosine-type recombinase/integrase n=1 Tax=Ramlibacter sp. TaxID=1917967 RepID=UPI002623B34A|nr:site-specific integrase [Ramlibacter sp.]MDB5956753.1 integrase [Ramlibacter sp.]
MPKKAQELGPLAVSRLTEPGLHFVGGVASLALQVTDTGARSWILRVSIAGKRRDMGLGGFPDVTLAGARDAARTARAQVKAGIDPIEHAKAAKSALAASRAKDVTFEECAAAYIETHEKGWKNAKHRAQWVSTLKTYAYPEFGNLLIRDVEVAHVLAALEPIWTTKTETASRLRGRIESVLNLAIARGYRTGLNPARWTGHLALMLPSPKKITKDEHFPAVPVAQVGSFLARLRQVPGTGSKALQFATLTATRSGEVRGTLWTELDLEARVWTIPAERMKAGVEHRVPLSAAALKLVKAQPRIEGTEYVFASARGGAISDMTMLQVMRRMKVKDAKGDICVPHGLRSTFRDWCAEQTSYPHELSEVALAHQIPSKTEAAYRRGDMLEKRRRMMNDWAAFCAIEAPRAGTVVPLKPRKVGGVRSSGSSE